MARFTEFQGRRVSRGWKTLLSAAWADGVRFQLNDGARTMAIQRQRIRDHGLWSPTNSHGAAPARPWAPHIKYKRSNHAIDVDTVAYGGGEQHLQNWLQRHGVNVVNNVATEGWHLDPVSLTNFLKVVRRVHKRRKHK